MGKNTNRRPQATKPFSRLGVTLVGRGMAQGTFNGGRVTRVQTPAQNDE
jgi:hypothetical protein